MSVVSPPHSQTDNERRLIRHQFYSIISQVDSRLNTKAAAASSRDSAAMKTFAFLIILFLPGTYNATIFSTGMFNWSGNSDGSGDGRVVSKLFWVHWALSVPLTIVVAVGWRPWWKWDKRYFDENVKAEIKAIDGDGQPRVESPGRSRVGVVPLDQ